MHIYENPQKVEESLSKCILVYMRILKRFVCGLWYSGDRKVNWPLVIKRIPISYLLLTADSMYVYVQLAHMFKNRI